MFDIGFGEMILLAAIALIAIGPKQLPEVARTVGKLVSEFKKALGDVTTSVAKATSDTDKGLRGVGEDLIKSVKEAHHVKPEASGSKAEQIVEREQDKNDVKSDVKSNETSDG